MEIVTSLIYALLAVLPWICNALPRRQWDGNPGGGVYIAELGLMYDRGVLRDPVTGLVSKNNAKAQNTNWGYYKPGWEQIPQFPRRREILRPRKVNANMLSQSISRPPITSKPSSIKPVIMRVGIDRVISRQHDANRVTGSALIGNRRSNPSYNANIDAMNANPSTAQRTLKPVNVNRNRVNVNVDTATQIQVVSNPSESLRGRISGPNNFLLNPANKNIQPSLYGGLNQPSVKRPYNAPTMFGQRNTQSENRAEISRQLTFGKQQNAIINRHKPLPKPPLTAQNLYNPFQTQPIAQPKPRTSFVNTKGILVNQPNQLRNQPKNMFNPTHSFVIRQNSGSIIPNQIGPHATRVQYPRLNTQFNGQIPPNGFAPNPGLSPIRLRSNAQRLPGSPATLPVPRYMSPAGQQTHSIAQYVYDPRVYNIPGVWNPFHPSAAIKTPPHVRPVPAVQVTPPITIAPTTTTTTTTTIVLTQPPQKPVTTEIAYWNFYDWAWADPYTQQPQTPGATPPINVLKPPSPTTLGVGVHSAAPTTGPRVQTPVLITTPPPATVTVAPTTVAPTTVATTKAAPTTPATHVKTTMSPKQKVMYMKRLLRPPFNPKHYEQICIHHNRTNINRTVQAFGPINEDCGNYVSCNVYNGYFFPKETQCDFGLWFDTGTGSCTDADAISKPCMYNPCTRLTSGQQVNIPYAGTCDGYFTCEGGSATAERCEMGANFDVATGLCCPGVSCPCHSQKPGGPATPDYQLQSFYRQHFPQFYDQAPPRERTIKEIRKPKYLDLQIIGRCRKICPQNSRLDPVLCQCRPLVL